ncbi:hypothetical protein BJ912DRAFT_940679 [Pholiota molesta]|nr:hypothetical protein BJ912DRAFT_940679 [Pholiota molesta]
MDEVFWSSVVKRWSDASESVIKLKKELASLQEERALYTRAYGPLSQLQPNNNNDWGHFEPIHSGNANQRADSDSTSNYVSSLTIQDELQDAEIGLGKAKEEYRKLQRDLAVSSQTVTALTLENQKLVRLHREEIEMLNTQKIFPTSVTPTADDTPRQSPSYPSNLGESKTVFNLQRQIEALTRAAEEKEADKQDLRHELASTRDKLHKAEENIKALLASIVKLQDIARHSAYGSLHPIPVNSLHSGSCRSSKLSFTSSHSHIQNLESSHVSKTTSAMPIDVIFPFPPERSDKVVVEHRSSKATLFPPLEREKAILKLPSISDTISIDVSENMFDRIFLKHILGEGVNALFEHLSENNEAFDKKAITSTYLCPTLDHHPWCPSVPGQHGFLFVGLGKDKDSYRFPVVRNLFVGLPKGRTKHRTFRYLGRYRVCRVKPLISEEWHTLPKEIKLIYANLTRDKGNDPRPLDEILSSYNTGELQIPCVQLQCISFDQPLYTALVSNRKSEMK